MNRHLAALALGLLGLFSAGAQAQQPLRRFGTEHFPPYTLLQAPGDQGAGPMAQLLLEACQLAGWRCEIKAYPWRRALRMGPSTSSSPTPEPQRVQPSPRPTSAIGSACWT